MRNNLFLPLLISLLFIPTLIFSQKFQDKTFTANQLQADFEVLKEALKAVHPALYEYQTPAEFEARCQKVENALKDGMTELDFLIQVSTITKSIGCAHTTTYSINDKAESKRLNKLPIEKRDTFNYLPFNGSFRNHRLFVGATQDSLLNPTDEIFSIDGHTVAELEQKVDEYPSRSEDGVGTRLKEFFAKEGILNIVYATFYPIQDSVLVEIGSPEKKVKKYFKTFKSHEISAVPAPAYDSTQWDLKFREDRFKKKYSHTFNSIFFYQHQEKDIATLKIKSFQSDSKKMLDLIFDDLKAKNTKNLIIDLRGNGGGDPRPVNTLLSKTLSKNHSYSLAKRKIPSEIKGTKYKEFFLAPFLRSILIGSLFKKKKVAGKKVLTKTIKPDTENGFKESIYVLMDGGVGSGASMFCAILKNDKRAIFLGEETAGAAQVTNGALYFFPNAPNSSISIRIPRYKFNHQITGGKKGRGVEPDYIVKETIESFKNKEDLGLKKVLALIEE